MADSQTTPTPGKSKWSSYMLQLYTSRKAPEPLGTVEFEEIEAKAKEKLKDYGGELNSDPFDLPHSLIPSNINRRFHVCRGKRRYQYDISLQS